MAAGTEVQFLDWTFSPARSEVSGKAEGPEAAEGRWRDGSFSTHGATEKHVSHKKVIELLPSLTESPTVALVLLARRFAAATAKRCLTNAIKDTVSVLYWYEELSSFDWQFLKREGSSDLFFFFSPFFLLMRRADVLRN